MAPERLALEPGAVIDGFRLEERLHRGGMATLWSVTRTGTVPEPGVTLPAPLDAPDPALPLLMKLPRIEGGDEPANIVGFEVESMILPLLAGPHVPRFVARGDFTRVPYLVMERIEGPSLRPRLDAAPLPVAEVADLGARVALALHELHRQHVVHLDVKPSNVLLRADGTAVLVDFGLSRHDGLPDLLDEEFALPLGTAPYMSPEQVQFVRRDPRSDLFALGVMLYHFTTGRRPFGFPDSVRGLRRRLYEDPVPPIALRPDCPPWLQEVILKCLEVDPERRHPSAAQLALDLQNPHGVVLGERAARRVRSSAWTRWRRRLRAVGAEPPAAAQTGAGSRLARSPILLVALDVEHAEPALLDKLRASTERILQAEPGARVACVGVLRVARIGIDDLVDASGQSLHLGQLAALRRWARPLAKAHGLGDGRLTFHVLEAPDAAAAIVEFARRNRVDHIVMGARASSTLRRYLGSVSSQVVAEADCSVTVVRV